MSNKYTYPNPYLSEIELLSEVLAGALPDHAVLCVEAGRHNPESGAPPRGVFVDLVGAPAFRLDTDAHAATVQRLDTLLGEGSAQIQCTEVVDLRGGELIVRVNWSEDDLERFEMADRRGVAFAEVPRWQALGADYLAKRPLEPSERGEDS